jgi:PAS domain S-box-containing protein
MSFRLKTILGIALIESVLLILLVFSAMNFLSESNEEQLKQRAQTTAILFTNSIKDALLSTDLATLESFVEDILTTPDMVYARISSNEFVLAEGGEQEILQRIHVTDKQLSDVKDGVFDIRIDIEEANHIYGFIEIGISTQPIESLLSKARRWSITIASLEVLLVALFSFVLGTYLSKQLQQLKQASQIIEKSGPGHQISVEGSGEIAELSHALNQMSSTLEDNYKALSKSIDNEKAMASIAQKNEAKNNAILTASLDALITIDDRGRVVDYNKAAEDIFGWSYDEIFDQKLSKFIIPPGKRHAHHQGLENYLTSKKSPIINRRLELNALHKLGHNIPIEINIAPIEIEQGTLFTAFIRDISTRLEAQTELRIAAKTFESSAAMFICDESSHIIRINHAFTSITGYEVDDLVGKTPRILSSGRHSKDYYDAMWLTLTETGQWNGEIYNKRKNGEIYPQYLNISSVCDNKNVVTHYIAHFMDITEQKNNEEKLRKARQEAETNNDAKSRFLAAMSHEIRTPMNAILGILGLLKETPLTARQLELVSTGRDSGDLLLTIINDILDFTKMDIDKLKLEKTAFDLPLLFKNCNELLKTLAQKKSISLTLSICPNLPKYFKGDPDRIRQILINLINNGIKFTHTGSVNVKAQLASQDEQGLMIRCQVQDTGIGIEEKDQSSLFDEFTMVDQTYSRKYEGTGLGLAICKRLVSLMQGEITFSSKPNIGSTFEFTILLQPANENEINKDLSRKEIQQAPLSSTRVLLAEDNPANQMVIKSILEFANLQVDLVSNGYEAIEAVKTLPYDIVLMDISMPEMDGMEATKAIRALSGKVANIPIIALTAHSLSGDRANFIAAGMDDYLSKPIDRTATLSCISHWTMSKKDNMSVSDTHGITSETDLVTDTETDNCPLVNEQVLQQLVNDTSAEIVPELLILYIEDSEKRVEIIKHAIIDEDFEILEFEAHTIGSSAIAHGNSKLHELARITEKHCKQQQQAQALNQAKALTAIAVDSFSQLGLRAKQGFIPKELITTGDLNE